MIAVARSTVTPLSRWMALLHLGHGCIDSRLKTRLAWRWLCFRAACALSSHSELHMSSRPSDLRMHIPTVFIPECFPEKERTDVQAIHSNLCMLPGTLIALEAAVALFEHSKSRKADPSRLQMEPLSRAAENRIFGKWREIAARAAAIAIYEFRQIANETDKLVARCPTIAGLVDRAALRESNKLFGSSFPGFENIRDFAAHGGECVNNPQKTEKHAVKDLQGIKSLLISGTIIGDMYTNTIEGKIVSFPINQSVVDSLMLVLDSRIRAFNKVEEFVKDAVMARVKEEKSRR